MSVLIVLDMTLNYLLHLAGGFINGPTTMNGRMISIAILTVLLLLKFILPGFKRSLYRIVRASHLDYLIQKTGGFYIYIYIYITNDQEEFKRDEHFDIINAKGKFHSFKDFKYAFEKFCRSFLTEDGYFAHRQCKIETLPSIVSSSGGGAMTRTS